MTRRDFRDITGAIYAAISGPAGPRDYAAIKHHYLPGARMVRTGIGSDGKAFMKSMSIDEHEADVTKLLAEMDFEEAEIGHEAEIFGNVARVKSIYRSRFGSGAHVREGRGVNFFNFVFDGGDWKIASVVWDNEREGLSLDAGD